MELIMERRSKMVKVKNIESNHYLDCQGSSHPWANGPKKIQCTSDRMVYFKMTPCEDQKWGFKDQYRNYLMGYPDKNVTVSPHLMEWEKFSFEPYNQPDNNNNNNNRQPCPPALENAVYIRSYHNTYLYVDQSGKLSLKEHRYPEGLFLIEVVDQ